MEEKHMEIPAFFNVMEMAALLGISRTTAYALARTPGFPCGRIGNRIVISRDLFLAWIDENFCNQYIHIK